MAQVEEIRGDGGYAVIILLDNTIEYSYSKQLTNVTNNQMELQAILHAFKYIISKNPEEDFVIYCDSAYCVNICNDWIFTWAKNNWINSKKEEIKNIDLIKELYSYLKVDFPNFRIEKIPGHSNIIGNELADALCSNNEAKFIKIKKENNIRDKYDFII